MGLLLSPSAGRRVPALGHPALRRGGGQLVPSACRPPALRKPSTAAATTSALRLLLAVQPLQQGAVVLLKE